MKVFSIGLVISVLMTLTLVACNKAPETTNSNISAMSMTSSGSGDYKSLLAKYSALMAKSKDLGDKAAKGDGGAAADLAKTGTDLEAVRTDLVNAIAKLPPAEGQKAAEEMAKIAETTLK